MNELMNLEFENQTVRTVEIDGEAWWVAKDVCNVLKYCDPTTAVRSHCKGVAKLHPLPSGGGTQETRIINEPDLMRLIINCRLPAAEKFERWVFEEVLPAIRKTGSYISKDSQIETLLESNEKMRLKLQVFEEYQSDELIGFDEAAAMIAIYRKPPFGVKHFKMWLADKGVLTTAHHKNDKPIQSYIDKGWFQCVAHEYWRNGRRRYENRYLLTWRGINNLIDLAVTDKLVILPGNGQNLLTNS